MADVLKEVRIMFEGTDNVSRVIDGLSSRLDDFGGQVQRVTQPLADMANTVMLAEGALAALAAGGLILAFNASRNFENATVELQKVIGDEADLLDDAQANAIALSETYGEAAADILSSTAEWVQAGYNVEDSMRLTRNAMDLVIAGSIEANQATEILVATLAGFRAPAAEAARVVDILNEVSNRYATDVEQLGIGMAALSPIARLMNMDFEQTAGVLTPIIEVFRSGSEAADALKTALARIVDDRRPTVDTLTALGVSQHDLNGNLRSGYEILLDVARAFETLTPEQQFYHAQNLVGIEQAARMVVVLSNLDSALEVTQAAYGAQGSALQEVQARLASAEVQVNRFVTAAQNLAIAVGDQFRLAAVEAIQGGTDIEIALRNMVTGGTFAPIFDLLNEFARNLGADLRVIAQNLPEAFAGIDWSNLIASMRNVGGSIVGLFEAAFGDVDLTTVEGLRSAVQRVVDGIAALTNVTAGILESWRPFVALLAEAADRFAQSGYGAQTLVGNILGLGQAVNSIVNNFDILTGALTVLSASMSVMAGTQIVNMIGGLSTLASGATAVAGALGPIGLALAGVTAAAAALNYAMGELDPKWEENRQAISDNIDTLHGMDYGLDEVSSSLAETGEAAEAQRTIWDELVEAMDAMPESVETEITAPGAQLTREEIEEIQRAFADIGEEKTVTVSTEADTQSINRVRDIIWEELPDGRIIFTRTDLDQASLNSTSNAINRAIPAEKEMEVRVRAETDVEIARIQAQAENLQQYFEYRARVDVAEVEQVFETIRNQSNNITQMFENTGDVLSALAGSLGDISGLARLEVFELMEAEARRRDALLVEQQRLTTAQIQYLEARTRAMNQGQGIITIEANGLEPELELVLQKIIQMTQIRANEEGLNFLLGV